MQKRTLAYYASPRSHGASSSPTRQPNLFAHLDEISDGQWGRIHSKTRASLLYHNPHTPLCQSVSLLGRKSWRLKAVPKHTHTHTHFLRDRPKSIILSAFWSRAPLRGHTTSVRDIHRKDSGMTSNATQQTNGLPTGLFCNKKKTPFRPRGIFRGA